MPMVQSPKMELLHVVMRLCLVLLAILTVARGEERIRKASPTCRDLHLVSLENTSIGVEVSLVPKGEKSQSIITKTFAGRYLSHQCGQNYHRCQELLVVTSNLSASTTQHVVFVPLADGILLLDLQFNGFQLQLVEDHIIDFDIGCSPTAFFNIRDAGIYLVCLNLETHYLTVIEIYLDNIAITNTEVSIPLVQFYGLGSQLSDFEFVSLYNDLNSQLIYFATEGYLYALVPVSYLYYDVGRLPLCSLPEHLAYARDAVMIVYCQGDSVVYFDLDYEDWINQTSYSESGRPYVCPNADVHLAVYPEASYIQYGVYSKNTLEYFNIPENFDSGVCFGTVNNTLFAFIDKEDGAYILEAESSSLTKISSKTCFHHNTSQCQPLMVFADRYVVIREQKQNDASAFVVDSQLNYSAIITAEHIQADLMTLLLENPVLCRDITPGPATVAPDPATVVPPSYDVNTLTVVVVTLGVGILILAAVMCALTTVAAFVMRKRRRQRTLPIEESRSRTQNDAFGVELSSRDAMTHNATPSAENRSSRGSNCLNGDSRNVSSHATAHSSTGPAYVALSNPNHVYPSRPTIGNNAEQSTVENDPKHHVNISIGSHGAPTDTDDTTPLATAKTALATDIKEQECHASTDGPSAAAAQATNQEHPQSFLLCKNDTSIQGQDDSRKSSSASSGSCISTTAQDQGHESGDELSPEEETECDRENNFGDQFVEGVREPLPRKKALQAVRKKRKRAARGDPHGWDYQNLEMQVLLEDSVEED